MTNTLQQIEARLDDLHVFIEEDDVIQCDDPCIASILAQLVQIHDYEELIPFYHRLVRGIYEAKGAMFEVRREIDEMRDACFQHRLFRQMVYND